MGGGRYLHELELSMILGGERGGSREEHEERERGGWGRVSLCVCEKGTVLKTHDTCRWVS